ncbi:hypothetical protein I7V34_19990 [Bacillus sp. V3]|nr:hypothetical protein I7V34_19990 [Bacillus sp. V3]
MRITILAVTKTYNQYCIAGMTEEGRWVRPQPHTGLFWNNLEYSDGSYIKVGDVWEIKDEEFSSETDPTSPGHTENIRLLGSATRVKILDNSSLLEFIRNHSEETLSLTNTLNANGRSLCLIKIESFNKVNNSRITFNLDGNRYCNNTKTEGYPVTCLKWRSIFFQNIQYPSSVDELYICIGLARTEPPKILKEYPMVIGIFTNPEVPLPSTYPR